MNIMLWQIAIIAAVVLNSVVVLLQRVLLRDEDSEPISFSIFFQALTGIILGLVGFLSGDFSFTGTAELWLNLIIMIVLYGFGNVFIFKAIKVNEASKFTVIFASRALFTIAVSYLFLGEILGSRQWLGVILIFLGVLLVAFENKKSIDYRKGTLVSILAAASFGIANSNDRFLLQTMSLYPFLFLAFLLPAVFVSLLMPKEFVKAKMYLTKHLFPRSLLICLLYGASAVAFFKALAIAPSSSQVATINLTSVVLTVVFAVIFLKEKSNLVKKLIAAILSFIGLVLLG